MPLQRAARQGCSLPAAVSTGCCISGLWHTCCTSTTGGVVLSRETCPKCFALSALARAESEHGATRTRILGEPHGLLRSKRKGEEPTFQQASTHSHHGWRTPFVTTLVKVHDALAKMHQTLEKAMDVDYVWGGCTASCTACKLDSDFSACKAAGRDVRVELQRFPRAAG